MNQRQIGFFWMLIPGILGVSLGAGGVGLSLSIGALTTMLTASLGAAALAAVPGLLQTVKGTYERLTAEVENELKTAGKRVAQNAMDGASIDVNAAATKADNVYAIFALENGALAGTLVARPGYVPPTVAEIRARADVVARRLIEEGWLRASALFLGHVESKLVPQVEEFRRGATLRHAPAVVKATRPADPWAEKGGWGMQGWAPPTTEQLQAAMPGGLMLMMDGVAYGIGADGVARPATPPPQVVARPPRAEDARREATPPPAPTGVSPLMLAAGAAAAAALVWRFAGGGR